MLVNRDWNAATIPQRSPATIVTMQVRGIGQMMVEQDLRKTERGQTSRRSGLVLPVSPVLRKSYRIHALALTRATHLNQRYG